MEDGSSRSLRFRVILLWMGILLLGSFWLSIRGTSELVSLVAVPQVPREGQPVIATFKLNNPYGDDLSASYRFYANGRLLKQGIAVIAPRTARVYRYAYENPLKLGEQVNFLLRVDSDRGSYEKLLSTPAYPPQIWSSFTSFASFSTSVMSSISSMTFYMVYYQNAAARDSELNVGLFATVVLTLLLIFLELSQPVIRGRTIGAIGRLRIRFSTVTWILFIIFLGIVYTRVVMVVTS